MTGAQTQKETKERGEKKLPHFLQCSWPRAGHALQERGKVREMTDGSKKYNGNDLKRNSKLLHPTELNKQKEKRVFKI